MKTIPSSEQPLLIRTDFSEPGAWEAIVAAAQNPEEPFIFDMQIVDDPEYDGASVRGVVGALPPDYTHCFLVIADRRAMAGRDHPLLVVELLKNRGREFRAIASQVASIANNLSIGNMAFEEFSSRLDAAGVFRGLPGL